MKNKLLISALVFTMASVATAKDYGPILYSTVVAAGYEEDTLLVPELYIYAGNANVVGMYVWISSTTDGAAPENEACRILKHTSSSGELILDTEGEGGGNDAVLGFSASITKGDYIWIMDAPPAGAVVRTVITAAKVATGVAVLDYMLYLTNSADTASVRAQSIDEATDTEIDAILTVANQCSAYVADGTSEIDTTLENTMTAVARIETYVDDEVGDIQDTLTISSTAINRLENEVDDVQDTLTIASTAIDRLETAFQWNPPLTANINHVLVDSVWSTVGTHEVIVNPDGVLTEFWLTIRDSIALEGADSIIIAFGSTSVTAMLKADLDANEFVTFPTDLSAYRVVNPGASLTTILEVDGTEGNLILHGITYGEDIGYEVQTATIVNNGWSIWEYRSKRFGGGSGTPSLGAGGTL